MNDRLAGEPQAALDVLPHPDALAAAADRRSLTAEPRNGERSVVASERSLRRSEPRGPEADVVRSDHPLTRPEHRVLEGGVVASEQALTRPERREPGVFAREHRALTLGVLLSITAVAIEGMAVATIMPAVAVDLGGLEFYGWAFSAFMLTSLVGAIAAGQAADRRGAGPPALAGFALFAAGLMVAGIAPTWPVLLMGRAIQGLGAGGMGSASYVVVGQYYPERLRPRLMALLASAWVVPALIGPAIAGQVAEQAGWRWVFIGILPAVAIGAWMLLRSLAALPRRPEPSTLPQEIAPSEPGSKSRGAAEPLVDGRTPEPAHAASIDASLPESAHAAPIDGGALPEPLTESQLATDNQPDDASSARRVLTALRLTTGITFILFAAGLDLPLALLPAGVGLVLALPAVRTLLPGGTFTAATGLPASIALRGLLAFGFFGAESLIPLGLSTVRQLPPSEVGVVLTAAALTWVTGSWVQDRAETAASGALAPRAARAALGLALIALGSAAAAAAILIASLPVELAIGAWAVSGLGIGLCYPATTLTALGLAPSGQEGFASASLQVAETVGIATGTGAAGALVAVTVRVAHPIADGLLWGFLITLAATLLALAPAVRLAPSLAWWSRRASSAPERP